MKRILFVFFFFIASFTVDAQVNFMGIPVDGDAQTMLSQIRKRGFDDMTKKYEMENLELPILKGTFNGKSSHVYIATNHKKVYRVFVCEAETVSESQIIIAFNNLLRQFKNNSKYLHIDGQEIEQKEDISYEMNIHNKVYDASFYQIISDNLTEKNLVWFRINEFDGEYYISIFYDNLLNMANGEDL